MRRARRSTRPDYPLNANLDGLSWSWQGGYIFLALEGHYRVGAGDLNGFAYHLARDPNRTRISLTAQIDLSHDSAVLLDFDLGAMLNAPRPLSFERDGAATHSRPGDPVAAALVANLPGAFHVVQVLATAPRHHPAVPRKTTLPSGNLHPLPVYNQRQLPHSGFAARQSADRGARRARRTALPRNRPLPRLHHLLLLLPPASLGFYRSAPFQRRRARAIRETPRDAILQPGVEDQLLLGWPRSIAARAGAHPHPGPHAKWMKHSATSTAKLAAIATYPAAVPRRFRLAANYRRRSSASRSNNTCSRSPPSTRNLTAPCAARPRFTPDERRGFELFITEYDPRTGQYGADCFHCHGGPLFTDHSSTTMASIRLTPITGRYRRHPPRGRPR